MLGWGWKEQGCILENMQNWRNAVTEAEQFTTDLLINSHKNAIVK